MPSKRRTAAATKQIAITKPKPKIAGHTPTDHKFKDLEKLHEKTNVTSNLKLPQDHRLELDSPGQLRRKRRLFRDFNIEFADLNDARPKTNEAEYCGNVTDDDDLPEPHDILKMVSTAIEAQTPPSETNYSNSDLDSLIRAVPLDDNQEVSVARITTGKYDSKRPWHQTKSLVASPSTPPPTRKRNREANLTSPALERRNKLPKMVTCGPSQHAMVYA
jgi:ATP-dependent DNA helicase HFM1/MER3